MYNEQVALVADSDKREADTIARFLKDTLRFRSVVIASNGDEALEYIRNDTIGWVFSDMDLPGTPAIDLLKTVRQEMGKSNMPFIMLSSRSDKESLSSALTAGVSDYIARPFSQSLLYEKITRQKLLQDRRATPRATPRGDYPTKLMFTAEQVFMGEIVNVSMNGVMIRSQVMKGVTIYDTANAELTLDGKKVTVEVELVRVEAEKNKNFVANEYMLAGYRFVSMDEDAQVLLNEFINRHRVAEMRRKGLI